MFERYYEEELRQLYESGQEFARLHPDSARLLAVDSVGDRDPYVERLFEGFAFLTARIRERIDSSLPDIGQALVHQLWPHLLYDIPSLSIVEFAPRRGLLQQTRTIEKGAEVLSGALGPESTVCRFTTTQDVAVSPVGLARVERAPGRSGTDTVRLSFRVDSGVDWKQVRLAPLRLYCHGEAADAALLHTHLVTHTASLTLEGPLPSPLRLAAVPPFTPAGLTPEDSVLPLDNRSFWGYTLLLEYFAFPEKFLFVDLHGLDVLAGLETAPREFTLSVQFDRPLPFQRPLPPDCLRLHCTPVVNLFRADAEPILADRTRSEYPLVADVSRPRTVAAHSVVSVTAFDRASGQRTVCQPVSAFARHVTGYAPRYVVRRREGRGGLALALEAEGLRGDEIREETLSTELRCTNGALAREELDEQGLSRPGPGVPGTVVCRALVRPTAPVAAPTAHDTPWVFLSHLCATVSSLATAESLRTLLASYNWSAREPARLRIESITDVRAEPFTIASGGMMTRGTRLVLTMDEARCGAESELRLLGRILHRFFSHYAAINDLVEVRLLLSPSGNALDFGPEQGTRWPV